MAKSQTKIYAIWIADGSTLEQLRKRLKIAQEQKVQLAGKIMIIVEAFTQQPITVWYQEDPKSNDKKWAEKLLNKLPISGLLIVDLGFFSFVWFD